MKKLILISLSLLSANFIKGDDKSIPLLPMGTIDGQYTANNTKPESRILACLKRWCINCTPLKTCTKKTYNISTHYASKTAFEFAAKISTIIGTAYLFGNSSPTSFAIHSLAHSLNRHFHHIPISLKGTAALGIGMLLYYFPPNDGIAIGYIISISLLTYFSFQDTALDQINPKPAFTALWNKITCTIDKDKKEKLDELMKDDNARHAMMEMAKIIMSQEEQLAKVNKDLAEIQKRLGINSSSSDQPGLTPERANTSARAAGTAVALVPTASVSLLPLAPHDNNK